MGSEINNKIYKFLCNSKNVKKRRNTRLEKCYGHVNIATAYLQNMTMMTLITLGNDWPTAISDLQCRDCFYKLTVRSCYCD